MEVGDALCRGSDRMLFALLLEDLALDVDTKVLTASQDLFDKAVTLFTERPDKGWSLTDCTSFVAMQEHNLTDALTSDRHFQQAGFTALLTD